MWQRFSENARKVVFYAQEEAQKQGEPYLGPEHLLLGLLRRPDCLAAELILAQGKSLESVRQSLEAGLEPKSGNRMTDMTLTPRAKRIIDLAYDEARRFGNRFVGTEHLLLGLIRENSGECGRVLEELGFDLDEIRAKVIAIQNERGIEQHPVPSPTPTAIPRLRPDAKAASETVPSYYGLARYSVLARQRRQPLDQLALFLVANDEAAADAVRRAGGDLAKIQRLLETSLLAAPSKEETPEQPFASTALAETFREAATMNQAPTGAHTLLAILRCEGAATTRVLAEQGVSYDSLRAVLAGGA